MSWKVKTFLQGLYYSSFVTVVISSLYPFLFIESSKAKIFALFLFFSMYCTYLTERVFYSSCDKVNYPSRALYFTEYKRPYIMLCIVSFLTSVLLSFYLPLRAIIVIGGLFSCVFLYIFPLFYNKTLKNVFLLKSFLVPFIWASCISLVPVITFGEINLKVLLAFISCFLLGFINTLDADLKDIKGDIEYNISSISNSYSFKTIIILAIICVITTSIIAFFLATITYVIASFVMFFLLFLKIEKYLLRDLVLIIPLIELL